jgi:outer membrane protein OmpA-like peptidoglycan-associated protein
MKHSKQTYWIPLSDMMTGLMMIFLLIALCYMAQTTSLITEFEGTKKEIEEDLRAEFKEDLLKWQAELLSDSTIRFKDPTVLFDTGSSKLKPRFQEILSDFIPRYIAIVTADKYKHTIKEVRIEGHTSTFWSDLKDPKLAYIKNMELSQSRTMEALKFILSLPSLNNCNDWLIKKLTANGLSSSRPIIYDGKISQIASQRVEFRIVTDSEKTIEDIGKLNKITPDNQTPAPFAQAASTLTIHSE